ncbi:MAG TPA: CvpA family protein [Pyrinomonadaceae bacterium]|nr:CvpA family protein [Pyrinomonadaceae bacterium]
MNWGTLNLIDLVLVVIVLLSAINGWRRGFILGVLDLLGWALVLLAGLRFYQPLARWIGAHVDLWSEVWDRPFAFILIAILATVAVQALGKALLGRVAKETHEGSFNRALGVLPGVANGLITAALIAAFMLAIPLNEGLRERARESAIANRLAVYAERLEAKLHPVFAEAVAETLNLLTVQPESHERVNLPYKVANSRPRPDLEAQMLVLVNRERAAAGLRPLTPDPELTEVARGHSADMFARGYFAHDTPEGLDPFARMREAHVRYVTAGENLALAPTLQVAHSGLMNSPGHRANILHPQFGRLGIGIMDGGIRGLMVSQEFRD